MKVPLSTFCLSSLFHRPFGLTVQRCTVYASTGFKIKSITGFVWLSLFFSLSLSLPPSRGLVQLQLKGETVRFECHDGSGASYFTTGFTG